MLMICTMCVESGNVCIGSVAQVGIKKLVWYCTEMSLAGGAHLCIVWYLLYIMCCQVVYYYVVLAGILCGNSWYCVVECVSQVLGM